MRIFLVFCSLWLCSISQAQKATAPSTHLGLFFPVEKSNINILPQRFEYELINKDKFRVGNILFDARLFSFRVGKGSEDDKLKLQLKWPAGLLAEGEISIRDNIGKAIWIHPIDQKQVKFQRKKVEKTSQILANLEDDILPEDVFRSLQYVPYFQVCVEKAELPTRISLCSKDFYVQVTKGRLEIRSRDSLRRESYVNINARKVGAQGLIFLQSLSDVISMRVLLLSGATLDIDTRMKEVEFRDIVSDDDRGRLLITGFGSEPAGSRSVNLADGSWRTEIPLKRPVIYLRGEGGIPMRQEFVMKGNVRDQSLRVEVLEKLPVATYQKSLTLDIKKNPLLTISAPDQLSELEDKEDYLQWTLKDLQDGVRNRRTLLVNQQNRQFTAAWDVIRHPRWDLSASFAVPLDVRVHLRGWMENQNLGFGLDYQSFLTEWKKDVGPTGRLRLPLYWSLPNHYNFLDSAWGIMMAPESITFKQGSAAGISLGGFWQLQVPESYSALGQWNITEVSFFHLPMAGDMKIKNELFLRSEFLYPFGERKFWWWGFEVSQITAEQNSLSQSLSRVALSGGLKWQF